jgi:ubiquinone/menaquinone biosynthesis C-methylase UbiE
MHKHFSCIATSYNEVRTTDPEPVLFIRDNLKGLSSVKAADIGCGAGRYDLLLYKHLDNLQLTCVDINEFMLEQVSELLMSNGISNFTTIQSDVESLELEEKAYDCILTFNAIHHFDFMTFLQKSAGLLKVRGWIFIYTRLQSQNARNIWGRYFPYFIEKEDRLYEQDELVSRIDSVETLSLESIEYFKYRRRSTLKQLSSLAACKHYSTFCLYTEDRFRDSLKVFEERLRNNFQDINCIEWFDENVMFVIRRKNS